MIRCDISVVSWSNVGMLLNILHKLKDESFVYVISFVYSRSSHSSDEMESLKLLFLMRTHAKARRAQLIEQSECVWHSVDSYR